MYDYKILELEKKLKVLGIKKGDIVYCHNNVSLFGIPKENLNKKEILKKFLDILIRSVGSGGLLIFPTYTYSFSNFRNGIKFKRNEVFSKKTPTKIGVLSNFSIYHKDGLRTQDPFFSCVIFGKKNKDFIKNISNNSFDENSIFKKLLDNNAKLLNLNFKGYTIIHYIERKLKVKYRFDKIFNGYIRDRNKLKKKSWTIFVTRKNSKYKDDHMPLINYLEKKKIIKKTNLGRGELSVVSSKRLFDEIKKKIKYKPNFLTKYDRVS